jgi:hypothetical protein
MINYFFKSMSKTTIKLPHEILVNKNKLLKIKSISRDIKKFQNKK